MARLDELPPPTRLELFHRWRKRVLPPAVVEGAYPYVLGAVVAGVGWWMSLSAKDVARLIENVLPTAITVTAILAGFQGTIHTMLLSMARSRAVRHLQKLNKYTKLVGYVNEAVVVLLVFIVSSIVVLGIEATHPTMLYPHTTFAVLLGLFACCLLASYRIMRIVVTMLHAL